MLSARDHFKFKDTKKLKSEDDKMYLMRMYKQ